MQTEFAQQEGRAFVYGNGVAMPRGILDYPTVNEANNDWEWGNIGILDTGTDGDFDATAPADDLIDLVYQLKAQYRANATWTMNSKTIAAVRKLTDNEDRYIWQEPLSLGQPPMLLGYPVRADEEMPDLDAANDDPFILFGNFRRGYLIVDRIGVRVLRDPFTSKPYVLFLYYQARRWRCTEL